MNDEELANNPFLVLGLSATAPRAEVERAGQKLLAQLSIGVSAAKSYRTPFGVCERDESKVRIALSALRDPEQRVIYELWLNELEGDRHLMQGWSGALASIGWRGPCTE